MQSPLQPIALSPAITPVAAASPSHLLFLPQWHSLSRDEQAKYYEMARRERQLHQQLYPGWTARDNYAINQKKKKKKRDKSADGGKTCSCLSCDQRSLISSPPTPEPGSLKKCRARFGLDQQASWCKPCRYVYSESLREVLSMLVAGGRRSASGTRRTGSRRSATIWAQWGRRRPRRPTQRVPMTATTRTCTCRRRS